MQNGDDDRGMERIYAFLYSVLAVAIFVAGGLFLGAVWGGPDELGAWLWAMPGGLGAMIGSIIGAIAVAIAALFGLHGIRIGQEVQANLAARQREDAKQDRANAARLVIANEACQVIRHASGIVLALTQHLLDVGDGSIADSNKAWMQIPDLGHTPEFVEVLGDLTPDEIEAITVFRAYLLNRQNMWDMPLDGYDEVWRWADGARYTIIIGNALIGAIREAAPHLLPHLPELQDEPSIPDPVSGST